jgi:hypothetical protein
MCTSISLQVQPHPLAPRPLIFTDLERAVEERGEGVHSEIAIAVAT